MSTTQTDRRLVTIVLVLLGAILVVPALFAGFGMMGFGPMMGTGPMMGGTWGNGGTVPGWVFVVGAVMQLLFLALVAGGGYLLYRALTGSSGDGDRALEELRTAYARGELTDEEYETRKQRLERDG